MTTALGGSARLVRVERSGTGAIFLKPEHGALAGRRRGRAAPQRGVAALAFTVLLFLALVLGIVYVNRNIVFEQRASANQYRSTQAFEAAEAGLEWAVAQLDAIGGVGADCLPLADATSRSFRQQRLRRDASTGALLPGTWLDAGIARPLAAACVGVGGGWRCSCPTDGVPVLPTIGTATAAPTFSVAFESTGRPDLVRLVATGCSGQVGACASGDAASADATARTQVLLGLLPALRSAPTAPITARGAVLADAAAFGAHNPDAGSAGLAIHAGGSIAAASAHLTGPAGGAASDLMLAHDAALAGADPERFFAGYFGLDRAAWARQPGVRRLRCSGNCGAEVQAAVAEARGFALIHVDGDLLLDGAVAIGTPSRPVVLVATGAVVLRGPVVLTGVLYAASIEWTGAAVGGRVDGALIAAGEFRTGATPEIVYRADVLTRLRTDAGTFARVNGSWRDF